MQEEEEEEDGQMQQDSREHKEELARIAKTVPESAPDAAKEYAEYVARFLQVIHTTTLVLICVFDLFLKIKEIANSMRFILLLLLLLKLVQCRLLMIYGILRRKSS